MYDGYVTDVTVSHGNCSGLGIPLNQMPVIACEGLDVAFTRDCPATGYAFDGSKTAALQVGDTVISYGFAKNPMSWQGIFGRTLQINETKFCQFCGKANLPDSTFLIFGDQNTGASGAAVLNGDGLAGICSGAMRGSFTNNRIITVTPIGLALSCMKAKGDAGFLKRMVECHHTKLVKAPSFT